MINRSSGERTQRHWRLTISITILVIAGTWFLGERLGFDTIGGGGTNRKLLPRIGELAPDIEMTNLTDGRRVKLSDYRGQPVWLNFWGSWCPPCRSEFPELQAAYISVLEPEGVVFLAISLDESAEDAAGYAARNGGTFTSVSDTYCHDPGRMYPIASFPTHIFIDRDGIIRDIILAPIDREIIASAVQVIIDDEPLS